jgi:DNA-binding transcriptional LysR family regulator
MIDELQQFLLIVEHGTFTEAARRAHLSQPALTASIRRLESELGAPLLHRGRHGAEPTAAGTALLPHARAIFAAIEDGRRAIAEVTGLTRGEVRIGAGGTACAFLLPEPLAAFRRKHPKIRHRLYEHTVEEAHIALEKGDIDLAIVTSDQGEHWMDDELILVAAPGTDPRGAPFVTFRPGATTRSLFERHFPEAELAMELGSIGAVIGHVRTGIGMALVSRAAAQRALDAGSLIEIRDRRTPIVRSMYLVHRGEDRLAPAARALREHLLAGRPKVSRSRARSRRGKRGAGA